MGISVRSTYKLIMEKFVDQPSLCREGDWNLIWKLHIPPRVNEGCWEKLNHKQRVDDFVLEVDSPIFKLLQGLRDQQRRRVAMLLWSIWRRRNEKLWNNQAELDVAAIQRGDDTTTKFLETSLSRNPPQTPESSSKPRSLGNAHCVQWSSCCEYVREPVPVTCVASPRSVAAVTRHGLRSLGHRTDLES
ncbi:hypothetical protein JHK82_012206 [Glycine max]|nr:hypothetical protein JHK85_012543 [Glycine max]KAG5057214.1 hypothetical protein JHK86_012210 [Glycine max]KAG5154237.1 hypothetical protein JHK82_012206 [Glycine max]